RRPLPRRPPTVSGIAWPFPRQQLHPDLHSSRMHHELQRPKRLHGQDQTLRRQQQHVCCPSEKVLSNPHHASLNFSPQTCGTRTNAMRVVVYSLAAQRGPSRPTPESLTPPYGITSERNPGT